MHKLLRTAIPITFGMLVICIIVGCGDDSPKEVTAPSQSDDTDPSNPTTRRGTPPRTDDGPPPTILCAVTPAPGGEIPLNIQFTLSFCQAVVAVTVNGVAATGSGRDWTASPTLQEGDDQILNVSWTNRDGSSGFQAEGPYTVRIPDTTPPRITDGTVADGTVDVDPAPINVSGFRFDFHEAVAGSIKLTDEAGADLHWPASLAGQTATLTAIAGQELVNETTYKIEIDVHDGATNRLRTTITFVTKPK